MLGSKDEIDICWSIDGPKKQARPICYAERRQGKWRYVIIEVGGKSVPIRAGGELLKRKRRSSSRRSPNRRRPARSPTTKGPDININLPTPPGDVPAEGKK